MAQLIHEIWNDFDEDGVVMPALVLAGPAGDSMRLFMGPKAKLERTFEADSYFEAMSIFFAFNRWGDFEAASESDFDPYPEAWAETQRQAQAARQDG